MGLTTCSLMSPVQDTGPCLITQQVNTIIEQNALKNVKNCLNTNIYSCLDTSGGQSSDLYLNVIHFSMPVFIRHLWQLNTVVLLHWCLIHAVLSGRWYFILRAFEVFLKTFLIMSWLIKHDYTMFSDHTNEIKFLPRLPAIDISLYRWKILHVSLLTFVRLVATAKILAVKVGTLFKLGCLPCQPACLVRPPALNVPAASTLV